MAQTPSISFDDVLSLLRGPIVGEFESKYAADRGYAISPNWGDSQGLTKELAFTGVSRVDLEHVLTSRAHQLAKFIDAMQTLPDHGGEWPGGEGPEQLEPIQPGEPVVYARGFSIRVACTVWVLDKETDNELLRWLQFRRTPHHKKRAADLRRIFGECVAQK